MRNKKNLIIVSACLAGVHCNYKGQAKPHQEVVRLVQEGKAIPVCPEQLGGLTTPRAPAERNGDKVVTKEGEEVTLGFQRGANEVCTICELINCKKAILKAKSPSCGSESIYDGTFTGTLVTRDGILTEKLKERGVKVISEEKL